MQVPDRRPLSNKTTLTLPARTKPIRRGEGPTLSRLTGYVFSVLAAPVAQTCSLSVSLGIVSFREDFFMRREPE
jgi:hypothetical protein